MIRNLDIIKEQLLSLSDRDFLLISTMLDTLLDPDWTNKELGDDEAYNQSLKDIKNGETTNHDDVLKMFG